MSWSDAVSVNRARIHLFVSIDTHVSTLASTTDSRSAMGYTLTATLPHFPSGKDGIYQKTSIYSISSLYKPVSENLLATEDDDYTTIYVYARFIREHSSTDIHEVIMNKNNVSPCCVDPK